MATWTKVVTESSSGEITQNAATATTVADNAISLAKLAGIARGKLIYGDASGNPAALAVGTNGQVLKSDGTDFSWAADTDTGDVNQNAWSTITVPAGTTSQAADTTTDTLAFTVAGGMTITGAADDSIQFSSADTNTNQLTTFTLKGGTETANTTVNHGDTIHIAGGTNISTVSTSDGVVTINNDQTDTNTTTTADVSSALAALTGSDTLNIGDAGNDATINIKGNLNVTGTTTTINTGTLQVEDKLIKLADVSAPDSSTATGAGIQVEHSATEAEWPEFRWTTGKGGSTATGSGLTGWSLSNYKATANADYAIAVMDFKTDTGAPSGDKSGVGMFSYNMFDDALYIRTA